MALQAIDGQQTGDLAAIRQAALEELHLARWEGAWVIVNVLFIYKRSEQ